MEIFREKKSVLLEEPWKDYKSVHWILRRYIEIFITKQLKKQLLESPGRSWPAK